jgi:hypothetical protein
MGAVNAITGTTKTGGDGRSYYRDHKRGHDDDEMVIISNIMKRLLANKKLLILAGIVLLAVIVLAAIFILPLLGHVLDYVNKTGLKGVVERFWLGTGGGK